MKTAIVYGMIFLIAFFGITGIMINLNKKYNNIFKLDFSLEVAKVDSVKLKDSLRVADSLKVIAREDSIKKFEIQLKKERESQDSLNIALAKESERKKNEVEKIKRDSTYSEWKKNTVKLLQSMEAKKAAKILQGYSDNTARDLIYSMNKKKAAEIISSCNSDYASRITRAY